MNKICDDYRFNLFQVRSEINETDKEQIESLALYEIEKPLKKSKNKKSGKTLKDFNGMPLYNENLLNFEIHTNYSDEYERRIKL